MVGANISPLTSLAPDSHVICEEKQVMVRNKAVRKGQPELDWIGV